MSTHHTPRRMLLLSVAATFCIVLIAACSQTGAQSERALMPTLIPAEELTAPPSPSDDRKLLLVTLLTETRDDGQVSSTMFQQAQILHTYAPNVFSRPGAWTARLRMDGDGACGDEDVICYGIDDPRLIEVETTSDETPYQHLLEPRAEWQLVVPLYRDGTELGVTGIDVLDEAGAIVISLSYDSQTDDVRAIASPTIVPTETPTVALVPTATNTPTPVTPTATPVNKGPAVSILRPVEDALGRDRQYAYTGFDELRELWYTDITFLAQAEDSEDGPLSGSSLRWTTDRTDLQRDFLGEGATLTVRLYSDTCEGVVHRVTVIATDSAGVTASASRSIRIWTLC